MDKKFSNLTGGELDFSKNLIDDIFSGKSKKSIDEKINVKLNRNEIKEMNSLSEEALKIAGLSTPEKKNTLKEQSLIENCISILENKEIPAKLFDKVCTLIEKRERIDSFLEKFVKKCK